MGLGHSARTPLTQLHLEILHQDHPVSLPLEGSSIGLKLTGNAKFRRNVKPPRADPAASTGRRQGLQKVLADEIAHEAKPLEKMNRQTMRCRWIRHSHDSVRVFGTVLAHSAKKRWYAGIVPEKLNEDVK